MMNGLQAAIMEIGPAATNLSAMAIEYKGDSHAFDW